MSSYGYPSRAFSPRSAWRLAWMGLLGALLALSFFWLALLPGIDEPPSQAPFSENLGAYRLSWSATARVQTQLIRWAVQDDGFSFPALARATGFGVNAHNKRAPVGGSAGFNALFCVIAWPLGNETRSALTGQRVDNAARANASLFVLAHEQSHCLINGSRGERLLASPLFFEPQGASSLASQFALARLSALDLPALSLYSDPNALREESFADIRALLFLRQNMPPLEWAETMDQVFSRRALSETPFSLASDHASEGAIWALAAASSRLPKRLSADQIDRMALSLAHLSALDYFSAERDHGEDGWSLNREAAEAVDDPQARARLAALDELSAIARPIALDPMWSKAATESALGGRLPRRWPTLRARLGFSNAGSLLAIRSQMAPLALLESRSARLASHPALIPGPQEIALLLYQRQLTLDLARGELRSELGLSPIAPLSADEPTLRKRAEIEAKGRVAMAR